MGDFGICLQDEIVDFDPGLDSTARTPLFSRVMAVAGFKKIFTEQDIALQARKFCHC